MYEEYKDILKYELMAEIARIQDSVAALGVPRTLAERSAIARYGKLILVSQRLLSLLPQAPTSALDGSGPELEGNHTGIYRRGHKPHSGGGSSFRRGGRV